MSTQISNQKLIAPRTSNLLELIVHTTISNSTPVQQPSPFLRSQNVFQISIHVGHNKRAHQQNALGRNFAKLGEKRNFHTFFHPSLKKIHRECIFILPIICRPRAHFCQPPRVASILLSIRYFNFVAKMENFNQMPPALILSTFVG